MVSRQLPRYEVRREESSMEGSQSLVGSDGVEFSRLGMGSYQHNRDDKFHSPKHPAVVVCTSRAPFEIMEVDTIPPTADEAVVHTEGIGSRPLKLHQADGGLI